MKKTARWPNIDLIGIAQAENGRYTGAARERKSLRFYNKACATLKWLCLSVLAVSVFGKSRFDGYLFAQTDKPKVSIETPHCELVKTWDQRTHSWVWIASVPGHRVLGVEAKEEQANRDCKKWLDSLEKALKKSAIPKTQAGPAVPGSTLRMDIEVFSKKRVAALAMSLSGVLGVNRFPAQKICLFGNGLQMTYTHASPIPAKMVTFVAARRGGMFKVPGKVMCPSSAVRFA